MRNSFLDSTELLDLGWKGLFDAERGLSHTVRILGNYLRDSAEIMDEQGDRGKMEKFFDEKRIVKQIHETIFPIICEIDDFCKEKGIQYYLCAGTCLGAVRHNGFIPWDYDADIMFPRADYERFIREYSEKENERYAIGSLQTEPKWTVQYGGVWDKRTVLRKRNLDDMETGAIVDIYPIDGIPEGRVSREFYFFRMRLYQFLGYATSKTAYLPTEKFVPLKKLIHIIVKPFGWRYFSMKMNRLALKYPYEKSRHVGVGIAPEYGKREIMDKSIFDGEVRCRFIDRDLAIPKGYDQYLSNLYGDYMKVPEGAMEKSYGTIDRWDLTFDKG